MIQGPKGTIGAKTFTVDRSKWLCGELNKLYKKLENQTSYDEPESMLLDKEDRMCCLGFYARACGIGPKSIRGVWIPSNLTSERTDKKFGTAFVQQDETGWRSQTNLADEMMTINDNENLSPSKREKKLKSLFKKAGITLKFRGKYPRTL